MDPQTVLLDTHVVLIDTQVMLVDKQVVLISIHHNTNLITEEVAVFLYCLDAVDQ
jgi:hypothetical protein